MDDETNEDKPAQEQTPTAQLPDGAKEFTLKRPYMLATGIRLEKLTLRRPKVRDLKRAQRMTGVEAIQAEVEIAVLSVICTPPLVPEDFDEMDGEDYAAMVGFLR